MEKHILHNNVVTKTSFVFRRASFLFLISAVCFLFSLIFPLPATADSALRSTDPGHTYTIPFLTFDGGGHQHATSTSGPAASAVLYNFQPVIGFISAPGHTPDYNGSILGGLIISGEGGVTSEVIPRGTGVIISTRILRSADSAGCPMKLTWAYNTDPAVVAAAGSVTSVDIWRLDGPVDFNPTSGGLWKKIADNITSPTLLFVEGGAGHTAEDTPVVSLQDNHNAYYRVVPHGTLRADIFGTVPLHPTIPLNDTTVGKMDSVVAAGACRLISIPMSCGPLQAALAFQAVGNPDLFFYPPSEAGTGLDVIPRASGGNFEVREAKGFWVQNNGSSPVTLSFYGPFVTLDTRTLNSDVTLTGNPVPFNRVDMALNAAPVNDAMFMQLDSTGLDAFVRRLGGFDGGWGSFNLYSGRGCWYQKTTAGTTNRRWNINLQDISLGNNITIY